MTKDDSLYGLTLDVIEKIQAVFARFAVIDTVILSGIRAKGNYRPGSDIDLVIKTKGSKPKRLLYDVLEEIISKLNACILTANICSNAFCSC